VNVEWWGGVMLVKRVIGGTGGGKKSEKENWAWPKTSKKPRFARKTT